MFVKKSNKKGKIYILLKSADGELFANQQYLRLLNGGFHGGVGRLGLLEEKLIHLWVLTVAGGDICKRERLISL